MAFDFDQVYDRTQSDSGKWHRYAPDVLPMHVADMDFRSPEPVIRALRERVEHGFFGYMAEQPLFGEAAAARLKRRYGWEVPAESIVLAPGVINGFNLSLRALTKPGESVLMHTPMYPPILNAPANHGLERDEAPLVRAGHGRYETDWPALERAVRPSTRAFLLCNPHNPTGRVFDRAELERLAALCLERDLYVISDEIHCDLVYTGSTHTPIAALSPEIAERTVTWMAPSKTFNLPGLKCAIAVVTNPELRERLVAARGGLVGTVNGLGFTAAMSAYRDGDDWLAALLPYLDANRKFLAGYLAKHLPAIRHVSPEGTYLAWLDCRALPVADPVAFFLAQAKVGLNDGATFGELGKGFVRLNFGCPRPLLEEGLERMRRAVASL